VTVLDLVEENDGSDGGDEYIPKDAYNFPSSSLSEADRCIVDGKDLSDMDDDSGSGYDVEDLEW
jgi:hypothetical protein